MSWKASKLFKDSAGCVACHNRTGCRRQLFQKMGLVKGAVQGRQPG